MGKLEDLAAKVAAARDRYENLARRQETRIKQFEAPDRGKYGSDEDFRKEFAVLEKEITIARKELVLAELDLNNFAERRTLDPAEAAKMAKGAVDRADEERETRLKKAAGLPEPTDPGGQTAGINAKTKTTDDAFAKKVRDGLQQLGVLPSDDRRAKAEERNRLLEASRQAERQRKLERNREPEPKMPEEPPIGGR